MVSRATHTFRLINKKYRLLSLWRNEKVMAHFVKRFIWITSWTSLFRVISVTHIIFLQVTKFFVNLQQSSITATHRDDRKERSKKKGINRSSVDHRPSDRKLCRGWCWHGIRRGRPIPVCKKRAKTRELASSAHEKDLTEKEHYIRHPRDRRLYPPNIIVLQDAF